MFVEAGLVLLSVFAPNNLPFFLAFLFFDLISFCTL